MSGGKVIWKNLQCNITFTSPIHASKLCVFSCRMCADYDLCETCERICEKVHDKTHIFVKVPHTLNPNMMEGKTLLPGKLTVSPHHKRLNTDMIEQEQDPKTNKHLYIFFI